MKVSSSVSFLILSALSFSLIQSPHVWGNTDSDLPQIQQSYLNQSESKLGYIQTASRRIEIKVDNTYTIYNLEGKIVQENMTLEQLKAQNPNLSEIIERAISPRARCCAIADDYLMMYAH